MNVQMKGRTILHQSPCPTRKATDSKVVQQGAGGGGTSKTGAINKIPIRHTLTSKLRMKKANPLFAARDFLKEMQIPSKFIPEATPAQRRLTFHPGMFQTKNSTAVAKGSISEKKVVPPKPPVPAKKPMVAPVQQDHTLNKRKSFKSSVAPKPLNTLPPSNIPPKGTLSKCRQEKGNIITQNKSKFVTKPQNTKVSHDQLQRNILTGSSKSFERRETFSVSRERLLQNKKSTEASVGVFRAEQPNSRYMRRSKSNLQINTRQKTPLKSILRSQSVTDVRKASNEVETPRTSKVGLKNTKCVAFRSPIRKSLSASTGYTPPPSDLRNSLNEWLAKKGKASYNFYHLQCFGHHSSSIENTSRKTVSPQSPALNETITLESCDSTLTLYETPNSENSKQMKDEIDDPLKTSTPESTSVDFTNENKENVNENLAHPQALLDLKKLVFFGYPRENCEQWLSIISKSHPRIRDLPQYWECLAALEEMRGDLDSAVDCYGKAIMKGASTEVVEESLDQLWEKFSTLKIKQSGNPMGRRSPVDTKQIFKSTVIKFALQQKAVKKFSQEVGVEVPGFSYIVTPVRRSTRKSTSLFKTTPTLKCVGNLNDLEDNIKDTMQFRTNILLDPNN